MKTTRLKDLIFVLALTFMALGRPSDVEAEVLAIGNSETQACLLLIEGEITRQTLIKFSEELKTKRDESTCQRSQNGKPSKSFIKAVALVNSIGGDLRAAFQIMTLIKQHHLNTFLDTGLAGEGKCQSACALIFASGKNRHFSDRFKRMRMDNNIIGIHKPEFTEGNYDYLKNEQDLDKLKYRIVDFLDQNNVDPRFVIRMYETPSSNMYYPEISDLLIWRVITSLHPPESLKKALISAVQ